jgi:hypothetical protein
MKSSATTEQKAHEPHLSPESLWSISKKKQKKKQQKKQKQICFPFPNVPQYTIQVNDFS